MRRILALAFSGLFLVLLSASATRAGIEFGVNLSDGQKSFYLAISDRYEVPPEQVTVVHEKTLPDEELPVLFFISRTASVDAGLLVKLRLGGMSWLEIGRKYNVGPADYYVELPKDPGPPYGNAWGCYKKRNRNDWNKIQLTDREIIDLVNLKFMSEHYGFTPAEVVQMRSGGSSFVNINGKLKKKKRERAEASRVAQKGPEPEKHNKKGKGKGH